MSKKDVGGNCRVSPITTAWLALKNAPSFIFWISPPALDNSFLMGIWPLFLLNSLNRIPSSEFLDAVLLIWGRLLDILFEILRRFKEITSRSRSMNLSILRSWISPMKFDRTGLFRNAFLRRSSAKLAIKHGIISSISILSALINSITGNIISLGDSAKIAVNWDHFCNSGIPFWKSSILNSIAWNRTYLSLTPKTSSSSIVIYFLILL